MKLIEKSTLLGAMTGTIILLSGSLMAAEADLNAVKSVAQSLGDKANYSWRTSTETAGQNGGGGGGGGRMRPGPIEGKTEKDGFTLLSMVRGDTTTEAVMKGDKGAIKTPEGWVSLADANQAGQNNGGGGPNPVRFAARTLRNFKTPALEVADLAGKAVELKKVDDAYTGDLTEDAAKELLAMGGRRGGNAPTPTNAKGWVKFWSQDGVLTKYQVNVQGTISFNGNDRDIDRTTTTEIRDAGATTVTVPDEAKAKIG